MTKRYITLEVDKIADRFKPEISEYVRRIMNEMGAGVRRGVPKGFWDSKENRIGAVKMYINGIPKKSLDDAIKGLQPHRLRASVISGAFINRYDCSIYNMILECYPDKAELVYKKRAKVRVDYNDIGACVEILMTVAKTVNKPIEEVRVSDLRKNSAGAMLGHHQLTKIKEYYSVKREMMLICE